MLPFTTHQHCKLTRISWVLYLVCCLQTMSNMEEWIDSETISHGVQWQWESFCKHLGIWVGGTGVKNCAQDSTQYWIRSKGRFKQWWLRGCEEYRREATGIVCFLYSVKTLRIWMQRTRKDLLSTGMRQIMVWVKWCHH